MASGCDAKRGDIVRNLTTGYVGEVTDTMNSGRLRVKMPVTGAIESWERWNTEVLAERIM